MRDLGITPAYAGTTRFACAFFSGKQDHPRLRGNYSALKSDYRPAKGSPPLTRELRTLPAPIDFHSGITPAYAGTTN